uniref:Uncharacterized protein n=1 Tax=Romanomermis culicivorax TaxID=13658 RepID=A0A915JY28_ROMCU
TFQEKRVVDLKISYSYLKEKSARFFYAPNIDWQMAASQATSSIQKKFYVLEDHVLKMTHVRQLKYTIFSTDNL